MSTTDGLIQPHTAHLPGGGDDGHPCPPKACRRYDAGTAALGIDTLDDVAQLTALLTPAVHSPLD
jgi:hypothetical protein